MLVKFSLVADLLFHLIFCPMVYSPSFTSLSAQPLITSDSFLKNDYYLDSGADSRSVGSRDAYGNQLSQGYTGSGYQSADSSKGHLSSGKKGHQSHLSSAQHKESAGSLKHSEGSVEAEKDRVVKHQWDRGGGYVKEWNWDKGVHYEKESGSVSASDVKHKETENKRKSGERSKGAAGWQQHKNKDHERWGAADGYDKQGYRKEGSTGYSDGYGSSARQQGYNRYGSPGDPWSVSAEYFPLRAAASSQPYGQPVKQHPGVIRLPEGPRDDRRTNPNSRPDKRLNNWKSKNDHSKSLHNLIEKKFMPIYRKYHLASKRDQERGKKRQKNRTDGNDRRFIDLRLALSKEFLGSQGRWKLGHLFGNGLDAFSHSNLLNWH